MAFDAEASTSPVMAAVDVAGKAVPPVWPLASSVAVNPFLGQTQLSLAETGALLERVAGVRVTMPRTWYLDKIASGEIAQGDLVAALAAADPTRRPATVPDLLVAAKMETTAPVALPTVADLATVTGTDWQAIVTERIGAWAAGYFDGGQALWSMSAQGDAWHSWRMSAQYDRTPAVLGLQGFAKWAAELPGTASDFIAMSTPKLGLEEAALPLYFHRLLMDLGGWAQYARYLGWEADLAGGADDTLTELLAIRLSWEVALFNRYGPGFADAWRHARSDYATAPIPTAGHEIDSILQSAAERAAQRRLGEALAADSAQMADERPALQAAFCIDVRSEVFRRALEAVSPSIRTLGFAGFFGLGTAHRGFASDIREKRLPVLLAPGLESSANAEANADFRARIMARAARAWGRFKLAAVSSFAFVEATGPVYAGKLVRDALGLKGAETPDGPAPQFVPELPLADRITTAETVLRAMSLTEGFGRLVLLAGHGANVTNNPHASALHCGACGGYSGEVNARLLAGLLNHSDVREGLAEAGICIPEDTLFVAALHDTTTDLVTLYDTDHVAPDHVDDVAQARRWLEEAGQVTRTERALRLPRSEAGLTRRSRDWAEVRPEWGLAGCQAFVAAPRQRTAGRSLDGRSFLHDYDWCQDDGFGVLELILTAPVVVASWISLQYYGSSVAPAAFGAGNKLLHNATGGIGVVEGNGGVLRAGLPWQSVHDGAQLVHEPLRLTVCIEAPREAINDILARHPGVRALFDNGWLHLFAMDEAGRLAWRYNKNGGWSTEAAPDANAA